MKNTTIFSPEDFLSNNGFLTSVWGPPFWFILHIISFNYPIKPTDNEKTNYYNFIMSLKHILPCGSCSTNIIKNLKTIKFSKSKMKNRDTFSKAIYDLHEEVNRMLNKKNDLSYNDIRYIYENLRARCIKDIKDIKNPKNTKQKKNTKIINTEDGCIQPLYGMKSKCSIEIIPQKISKQSIKFDKRCILKKYIN